MLGKTHALGGSVAAFGSVLGVASGIAAYHHVPVAQLDYRDVLPFVFVTYPMAIWASKASDMDHHTGSVPFRDPVSVSLHYVLHCTSGVRRFFPRKSFVYKVLGFGDAQHRSWQTHSDLTLLLVWLLVVFAYNGTFTSWFGVVLGQLSQWVTPGLALGFTAHIVLDFLTPEGMWLTVPLLVNTVLGRRVLPEKFKPISPLVSLLSLKVGKQRAIHYFSTGNGWEKAIQRVLFVASWILFLFVVYLVLPWRVLT